MCYPMVFSRRDRWDRWDTGFLRTLCVPYACMYAKKVKKSSVPSVPCPQKLVEETRLLVRDTQFPVNRCKDALNLTKCKHASQKGVAGIVSVTAFVHNTTRFVSERHTVVNTHRKCRVLFFENTAQLNQIGTSA